ncbi:hypothetical protein NP233_g12485 [Leucocoprinus birnbaumii]|uniref:RNase III domain-containing protein n=1 Tax=Leucocoprinus birnbaumii TaxID=56174 RepID=A0AAD5VG88_9AGAR|nr:hypothetical protein NP233_g12485 [Leucocoprinus birnbaumii]
MTDCYPDQSPGSGKRHRSETPNAPERSLPRLPEVSPECAQGIYSESSSEFLQAGDPPGCSPEALYTRSRLAHFGEAIFRTSAICYWFFKQPAMSVEKLRGEYEKMLSAGALKNWVESYQMARRTAQCSSESSAQPCEAPEESEALFYAYIAAVYVCGGQSAAQEWIQQLISHYETHCLQASLESLVHPPADSGDRFRDRSKRIYRIPIKQRDVQYIGYSD